MCSTANCVQFGLTSVSGEEVVMHNSSGQDFHS